MIGANQCEHGQLSRVCELCAKADEITNDNTSKAIVFFINLFYQFKINRLHIS